MYVCVCRYTPKYPHLLTKTVDGTGSQSKIEELVTFKFQFYWSGSPDRGRGVVGNKGCDRFCGCLCDCLSLCWRRCIKIISKILMHNLIPPEVPLNRDRWITSAARKNKVCKTCARILLRTGGEAHAWSINPFAMTCKILITSRFV